MRALRRRAELVEHELQIAQREAADGGELARRAHALEAGDDLGHRGRRGEHAGREHGERGLRGDAARRPQPVARDADAEHVDLRALRHEGQHEHEGHEGDLDDQPAREQRGRRARSDRDGDQQGGVDRVGPRVAVGDERDRDDEGEQGRDLALRRESMDRRLDGPDRLGAVGGGGHSFSPRWPLRRAGTITVDMYGPLPVRSSARAISSPARPSCSP